MEPVSLAPLVWIPLAGAGLVALTGRWPNLRETVTLVTTLVLFTKVWLLLPIVESGARPEQVLAWTLPGLPLALEAEPLGMLFALVASFLWIVTSVYSIGYMRGHHESHQTRFYVCFAIAIGSAMGVAMAGNLFTLFVFYEILTLSTYPLVTHSGTAEARRAGRVYLGILIGTSMALQLPAIIATRVLAGTADFEPGGILAGRVGEGTAAVLLALYVFGIGKAAVMPFHRWLPAAMVAPTPVSALLHAVAVVKAGVFAILKIVVYVFGIDLVASLAGARWLAWVAAFTILAASIVAMTRENLKARLAYSTVSQLSYIVLGALVANVWGVVGAALHILMHAFGKITLFFCAGSYLVGAHRTEVGELRGIGRRMPITTAAFLVGSLSIIGVPLFGGLWSKWYLGLGTVDAGAWLFLATLMVSSLLNIGYLLPIPVQAWFPGAPGAGDPPPSGAGGGDGESEAPEDGEGPGHPAGHGEAPEEGFLLEAPLACLLALVTSAAGCLFLFWNVDRVLALVRGIVPG